MSMRRFWQFRLRTLMALVGVVCLISAYLASVLREMRREATAVAIVRSYGVKVGFEQGEDAVTRFTSAATRVWPLRMLVEERATGRPEYIAFRNSPPDGEYPAELWQALGELTSIGTLSLAGGTGRPVEQLARIPPLPRLRSLALPRGMTSENLASLAIQPSVSHLEISGCELTRHWTETLASRFPGLTQLNLHISSIADDALRGLDGLHHSVHVGIDKDNPSQVFDIRIRQGNQVSELTISGSHTRQIEITQLPRLNKCNLFCRGLLENATFRELPKLREVAIESRQLHVSHLPELQYLVVRCCSEFNLQNAPALKWALFTRCTFPAEQWGWITECPELRDVTLEPIGDLPPDVLQSLARSPSLRRLTLDACHHLRTEHFDALATSRTLADLSLYYTPYPPADLDHFLSRTSLQRLTISSRYLSQADETRLRMAYPEMDLQSHP